MYTWFCFLNSPLSRVIIQNRRHGQGRARQRILLNSTAEHLFIYREKKLHFQAFIADIASGIREKIYVLETVFH